jgi:hypothetical protein
MIKYSQFFPEKYLQGDYEIEGNLFNYPFNNKGKFNLSLCESHLKQIADCKHIDGFS